MEKRHRIEREQPNRPRGNSGRRREINRRQATKQDDGAKQENVGENESGEWRASAGQRAERAQAKRIKREECDRGLLPWNVLVAHFSDAPVPSRVPMKEQVPELITPHV